MRGRIQGGTPWQRKLTPVACLTETGQVQPKFPMCLLLNDELETGTLLSIYSCALELTHKLLYVYISSNKFPYGAAISPILPLNCHLNDPAIVVNNESA